MTHDDLYDIFFCGKAQLNSVASDEKMKTLLVVKDPELLTVMAEILHKRFGHAVTSIGTMDEALSRVPILAAETELLIVSLNLGPKGAEPIVETARLRNPRLPVLLIAGSQSAHDRERIAHMRASLWQTADMADLVPAIGRALKAA